MDHAVKSRSCGNLFIILKASAMPPAAFAEFSQEYLACWCPDVVSMLIFPLTVLLGADVKFRDQVPPFRLGFLSILGGW